MQPTIYAGVVLAMLCAVFVTRDRVKSVWWLFAFLQLFGATSAATLSALGGSSLTAPQLGVAMLLATTTFVVAPKDGAATRRTVLLHCMALAIIVYTLVISMYGPRLFAGKIDVVAMRPDIVGGVAVATPLEPRSGNITQSLYLTGSFLTALATSLLFARRLPATVFQRSMLFVAFAHALLGLIDAAGLAAGRGRVLDFLRNASFSMLDQTIGSVPRLSGSLPEPSSYAAFGVAFAVFATEQWVRTSSRVAGATGLFLWAMILASTSSTGMFGAGVYALIAYPRFLMSSVAFSAKFASVLVISALALAGTCVSLLAPDTFVGVRDFIVALTIDKGDSASGIERASWAAQGWTAFNASFGLGTGAGSFRSSSFPMAVLGSLGVIGSLLMLGYIGQVSWKMLSRNADATQRSAGWAAIFTIVTALASAGSPDPSFAFGIFAGFALHPNFRTRHAEDKAPERTLEGRGKLAMHGR